VKDKTSLYKKLAKLKSTLRNGGLELTDGTAIVTVVCTDFFFNIFTPT
jgi:hypothetical protein